MALKPFFLRTDRRSLGATRNLRHKREFNLTVYAVGATVEKALAALAEANKWGEIENVEFQPVDIPANWYVRFVADGTGMKAAGEYLTGGVIVTWWK